MVDKNKRMAVQLWAESAEQGDTSAQFGLGEAYWSGEGAIMNAHEAYIWYAIAKANGNQDAARALRFKTWSEHLSKTEIRAAQQDAARRLKEIERGGYVFDGDG